MRTVMVFGSFDGLHEGHKDFLRQARLHGTRLIVNLAPDTIIKQLKGREPEHDFEARKAALEAESTVDAVLAGDAQLGTYRTVVAERPDTIALGYDQDALEQDLRDWIDSTARPIKIVKLKPYHPETYKSSKLRAS